jgi:hypothetical protein
MTGSLGGIASLAVIVALFVRWRTRRLPGGLVLVMILIAVIGQFSLPYFFEGYNAKGLSATVREDNVLVFYNSLLETLLRYPFGSQLVGNSLTAVQDVDGKYLGSNFAPYTALMIGGLTAVVGYVAIFASAIVATLRYFSTGDSDKTFASVFISIPPLLMFVFQRTTIVDSALFALLFVPALSAVIRGDIVTDRGVLVARRQSHGYGRDVRIATARLGPAVRRLTS